MENLKNRDFEIILYRANGYTAEYVIREFEKTYFRIAVSARGCFKVNTSFPKIECSIEEIISLARRTKILVNCIGAYSLLAEPIT